MRTRSGPALLASGFILLCAAPCTAQFAYVGMDLEYDRLRLRGPNGRPTSITDYNVVLSGQYRFIKNLSVGITYSVPIKQQVRTSFAGASTSDAGYFSDWGGATDRQAEYAPDLYAYDLQRSSNLTAFARVFVNSKSGFHFDVRFTSTKVTESFIFMRSYSSPTYDQGDLEYPAIPFVAYSTQHVHSCFAPGLGIGFMPHLGEHFFLYAGSSIDFFNFTGPTFDYTIAYDYTGIYHDGNETVRIQSALVGHKNSISLHFGGGAYF